MTRAASRSRGRPLLVHSLRVLLFALTIGLIHIQFTRTVARQQTADLDSTEVRRLHDFFPDADALIASGDRDHPGWIVQDSDATPIGRIVYTSPGSDHVIGFSGPTNTQIALTADGTIAGIEIVSSQDTREHLQQVLEDDTFLKSFAGCRQEDIWKHSVDAVSGATLTSRAIQEAIVHTLSGRRTSLRFPDPLTVDQVAVLFPTAVATSKSPNDPGTWLVTDESGHSPGMVVRSSPHSDNIIGYQGPSETFVGLNSSGHVIGISLPTSYDNEPYIDWIRDDEYFRSLFNDLTIEDLANLDPEEEQIEGVSGATMTSVAMAHGLIVAAQQRMRQPPVDDTTWTSAVEWTLRDLGTAAVVLCGALIALTSLRGNRTVRVLFQLVLIIYLGFINGDLISQAMLVGWAQAGVPWERAGGLVLLSLAAFCIPLTTRRNVYCTHLCPHGAVQQLIKSRSPWRVHLSRRVSRTLRLVPVVLLAWCVVVAMTTLPFSLVDIEPFDAWLIGIAGWASITIAIVGLVASLFVPMAYCRFGCPTGTLLNYLRVNGRSGQWSRRDWMALALVLLAAGIYGLS